jgi:beta-glucosidase
MGNSLRKKPTFAVGRQNDLVKAVLETGKPTVVLLINSGPLSINYIAENVSFSRFGYEEGRRAGRV